MRPTPPDKKTKEEKKADWESSSKILSKDKLKQSYDIDLLVPFFLLAPMILTKKHGLNNQDIP